MAFGSFGRPIGFKGRFMLRMMNSGHAKISEYGMRFVPEDNVENAVDLGCGGGGNLARLLKKYPGCKVFGLDYSEESVRISKETNREEVEAGRCTVVQGDVSKVPFADCMFDLAIACETVYFWPAERGFREVLRVLRPGAPFVMMFEVDGLNERVNRFMRRIDGLTVYTAESLASLLEETGFDKIEVHHDSPPLLVVVGHRPE